MERVGHQVRELLRHLGRHPARQEAELIVVEVAAVDPRRRAHRVTAKEWREIYEATEPMLTESASVGGTRLTSLDDLTYIHEPKLHLDNFEVELQVYGRAGESCRKSDCEGTVERFSQEQRSSFVCLSCQR